ncbi:hypothetical protein POUND7_007353 [Theobroma cacao]
MSANSKITTYLQNLRSLNWEVMAGSDTQARLFHLSTAWDPCVKRLRRIAIMFYIYVNFLAVLVQVTFSDDAILVSSPLHQIPVAMRLSLFWITLVVYFLFCCFSMASKI